MKNILIGILNGQWSLSYVVMLLLLLLGILLTAASGFFPLRRIKFIFKNTAGTLLKKDNHTKKGSITPFQAVTTALAGTMGVGNIAGVATALVSGGPGAIFWMWVSAFFGMTTKYAEIYLAVKFRKRDKSGKYRGGPMYYIEDGLGKKWLAVAFSVLCVLTSCGIGSMTQVNSVSTAAESAFSVPLWGSGIFVCVCLILIVFGGVSRIAKFTEMVIPFISIIYICFSVAFLFINRNILPSAFTLILRNALGFDKAVGGALGYTVSQAVRLGLSRGVFTNEAGLGSAPIAHASADCKSPSHQAVWGVFEVFLDTIVVCTITALVLLTAGEGRLWLCGLNGAPLTTAAFESVFGSLGEKFIALSITFFAIPSMLGWCFYGESAMSYLTGGSRSAINAYRVFFILFTAVGSVMEMGFVWAASDIFNCLMAMPNILALFLLRKQISYDIVN